MSRPAIDYDLLDPFTLRWVAEDFAAVADGAEDERDANLADANRLARTDERRARVLAFADAFRRKANDARREAKRLRALATRIENAQAPAAIAAAKGGAR
jgi:hypothetical protein